MNDAEQTLRLLRELERIDREEPDNGSPPVPLQVSQEALLAALVVNDYDLTSAILGVET